MTKLVIIINSSHPELNLSFATIFFQYSKKTCVLAEFLKKFPHFSFIVKQLM